MRVTRRATELQARGVDILSFGAGEPDFPSLPVAVDAARSALAEGFTRYTPAAGIPDLRAALLARYESEHSAPWSSPEEVLVSVGAKAALFQLALALVNQGDEVVIPSPCWVTFPEQVVFCGGKAILVPTSAKDGFEIHADAIISALGPATRAVILNTPANPTGGMLAEGELRKVVEACAERDVVVISDETYERFVYEPRRFASAASLAAEFPRSVVVVGSFSKSYAMTGWRVGYVLGPRDLLRAVAVIQSHATSNPTSFAMVGALAALKEGEEWVREMVSEFRSRRDFFVAALDALPGVSCQPPAGAFYAFPRVADLYAPRQGSAEFAEFLLSEGGIAVVPGVAFGNDEHIRLSFTRPREDLEEGIRRLRAVLQQRTSASQPRVQSRKP